MAKMTRSRIPSLVFQPNTYRGLLDGIRQITDAIRPTFGPLPRYVAVDNPVRSKAPEILDKGALIARRVTDLSHPDADVGAMLLRHMLWKQYELIGDGTATSALLFESVFTDCVKYVTAGYDAVHLRQHLLSGLDIMLDHLKSGLFTVDSGEQIEHVALSLCHDQELSAVLGEIFDTLGAYGMIDIHRGYSRQTQHEYVHGVLWDGGIHAPELLFDKLNARSLMMDAAVFISDLDFDDPRELVPIIKAAHKKAKALIIVCNQLSSRGIGLLTHINNTHSRFSVIAVKMTHESSKQAQMLEELAMMTGGKPHLQQCRDMTANLHPDHLGRVSEAWANKHFFCVTEDHDAGKNRASYLLRLESQYQHTRDIEAKYALRERIGHLMGASATVKVGGSTESEIKSKSEFIQGVVKTLRSVLENGAVLGGGISLFQCQSALRDQAASASCGTKRAAFLSLAKAVEQPIRQICANAAVDAGSKLALINSALPNCGYDARTDRIVDMYLAGIFDSYEVVAQALETAVRTAALALTIDAIVHHRNPEHSNTP